MKPQPHLIEREMARRYASGDTAKCVGEAFGVSGNVVLRAVRSQGGVVRPHGRRIALPKAQEDYIKEEFRRGVSAYSLGRRFRLNARTIQRIVAGIEPEAGYLPSPEEIERIKLELRTKRGMP